MDLQTVSPRSNAKVTISSRTQGELCDRELLTWEEDDDNGPRLDGIEDALAHVLDRYSYIAGGRRGELTPAAERAKAVCVTCAVEMECLTYDLDAQERDGIWGGMRPEEHQDIIPD